MKLSRLTPVAPAANLRIGALPPEPEGNYGKGRGGRPWRRLREQVLKRAGYRCQCCKAKGILTLATEVDHILPIFEGGKDDLGNLQAICGPCHQKKTHAESMRARKNQ